MSEEMLLQWLLGFVGFWLGILGDIVGFCVTWSLIFGLAYVVCRYLVCGNRLDEWAMMKADMQSGMRDLARAFRDGAPGVHAAVKQWATKKMKG